MVEFQDVSLELLVHICQLTVASCQLPVDIKIYNFVLYL